MERKDLSVIHNRITDFEDFFEKYFPESITNHSPEVHWEVQGDGRMLEPVYLPLGITTENILEFLSGSYEIVDHGGKGLVKDLRSSPPQPYVVFHAGGNTPDADLLDVPGQELLDRKIHSLTFREYLLWFAERSVRFGSGNGLPDSQGTATLCQTINSSGNFIGVFAEPKLSRITIDAVYPLRSNGLRTARRYGARRCEM